MYAMPKFFKLLSCIKLRSMHIVRVFQLNYIRKFESFDAYIPPCSMHEHTYCVDKQVVQFM